MVAGGRLCSRYFLNCAAGLPARCQGAALASRRTSSFAAKPCTWLSCSFPRFLCQAREGERQDLWAHSGRLPAAERGDSLRAPLGAWHLELCLLPGEGAKNIQIQTLVQ